MALILINFARKDDAAEGVWLLETRACYHQLWSSLEPELEKWMGLFMICIILGDHELQRMMNSQVPEIVLSTVLFTVLRAVYTALTLLQYFPPNYPVGATNYPTQSINYPVGATNYPLQTTNYPVGATNYPTQPINYPIGATNYPTHGFN